MYSTAVKYKVVLTGEWGVGKSSLFQRFLNDTFIDTSKNHAGGRRTSQGLDHFSRTFTVADQRTLELELWDTAGLERFESLSASYFTQARAVIICYSEDVEGSVHSLSQHILDATQLAQKALVFLCSNKVDLNVHPVNTNNNIDGVTVTDVGLVVQQNGGSTLTSKSQIAAGERPPKVSEISDGDGQTDRSHRSETVDNILMEYEELIERAFKVSCKTGEGVENMFQTIAAALQLKSDMIRCDRRRLFLTTQPSECAEIESKEPKKSSKCC